MDGATVAMLRKWRIAQKEARLALGPGYEDHDLVFCRPDGRPHHPESFSKTFDRKLRSAPFAELPTIGLHDLRHTWATLVSGPAWTPPSWPAASGTPCRSAKRPINT